MDDSRKRTLSNVVTFVFFLCGGIEYGKLEYNNFYSEIDPEFRCLFSFHFFLLKIRTVL